jgi:hypothetical protein
MATLFDDSVDEALVADAIAASNRTSIEPVTIEHRPDHSYRKGPKGSRGCKQPMPDGRDCGAARFAPVLVRGNVETRTVMLPSEVIEGGWLEDDDWSRYEFGNLAFRYVRGERALTLRLMPNALAR